MARSKIQNATLRETLGLKAKEFTFQNPPLIDAPHTQITKLNGSPRQLPDPSKTLKPAMGVERIMFNSLELLDNEKGSKGERVYGVNQGETRVRFVGQWSIGDPLQNGVRVRTNDTSGDSFIEITFYGTGLNIMSTPNVLWGEVFVDGASIGTPITAPGSTGILNGRNYRVNSIFPQVSGLSLGIHTVRILGSAIGGGSLAYGIEILNESTQIQVPQGEVFAAGNKFSNSALTALDYNSGFDGNPVLNGRGGRVSVYLTPEGEVRKAIQQTDAAQANLSSADHSNEEVVRKINFREFGANRGDDFSTLAGSASDRAYTLDDGTTTLVGDNVKVDTTENGLEMNNPGFYTLTFVGTGLDVKAVQSAGSGTTTGLEVFVDGNSIGEIPAADQDQNKIIKVVSGLPYGTHTVKFNRDSASEFLTVSDFIIYGPKKPEIPADAQEISDYYLMADFDASSVSTTNDQGYLEIPNGTLFKHGTREQIYVGTWAASGIVPNRFGSVINTTTNGDYVEYTFWGTGVEFVLSADGSAQNAIYDIQIDGVLTAGATNLISVTDNGGGSYTGTSSDARGVNRGVFSGLTLGLHTIRITRTGGSGPLQVVMFNIITPIHFPNTKAGSLSVGPGVQLQKETSTGGIDLGKAKALLVYDQVNNEILFSKNISAVLDISTGISAIYFEKPFKNNKWAAAGIVRRSPSGLEGTIHILNEGELKPTTNRLHVETRKGSTQTDQEFSIVFFGELQDEEGDE